MERPVDAVFTRLELLETRVATLEAENAELRATRPDARVGRRALMTGVAGIAAGTVLGGARPAAAANGDPLLLGQENTATSLTTLHGRLDIDGSVDVDRLSAASINSTGQVSIDATELDSNVGLILEGGSAVFFASTTPGIMTATGGSSPGIQAMAYVGPAILAIADRDIEPDPTEPMGRVPVIDVNGVAESNVVLLRGAGGRAHLHLLPRDEKGPPAPTIEHDPGEIALDSATNTYVCHQGGTPGLWHKLLTDRTSNGAAAGGLHLLDQPFRLHDSRAGQPAALSGPKGKLDDGETITLQVTETEPLDGGTKVPGGALAALCTIQAIDTTDPGYLRAFRTGGSPVATTLSFTRSQRAITTTFVRLSNTGTMSVRGYNASANIVIDILGWVA